MSYRVPLIELKPKFLVILENNRLYGPAASLAEAQGVSYLCPACFTANGGSRGTHQCRSWFRHRGVPDTEHPGPGRWTPTGTGFEDLTFVPGDPPMMTSVQITGGCNAHFLIESGICRAC